MDNIGYEFQPGATDGFRKRLNGEAAGMGPMSHEALQILSMRLPQVLGGRPMAPGDLMQPHMGGTQPGSGVVDTLANNAGSGGGVPQPPQMPQAPARGPVNPVQTPGAAGGGKEFNALMALVKHALGNPSPHPTMTPGDMGGPGGVTPDPGGSIDINMGGAPPVIDYAPQRPGQRTSGSSWWGGIGGVGGGTRGLLE